jgi:glucose/arabinose dehydrogenase
VERAFSFFWRIFLINYLALTILFALLLALAFAVWAWRTGNKKSMSPAWVALGLIALITAVLVIGSTELVIEPFIDISFISVLQQFSLPILALATGVIGILLAALFRAKGKKSPPINYTLLATWLAGISVVSLIAIIGLESSGSPPPEETVTASEQGEEEATPGADTRTYVEIASETLPEGFELLAVIPQDSIERPTTFTAGENGEIYIAAFAGGIYKLPPAPWDTADELITPFAPDIPQITGMVYQDGSLYANGSGSLWKLTDTDSDGLADTTEVLIEGMPSRTFDHHSNNGLTVGPDGRFYFALGGTTDHGPEPHDLAGNILVYDPSDKSLSVYAYGLRNSYDQAFCPSSSTNLYVGDNAPDGLDETLRYIPPDELNLVEPGKNYGYPNDFGFPPPWSDSEPPIALMETAGVPTGILCYEARDAEGDFPAEYNENLFVGLAGGSNPLSGHKIVRVQIETRDGQTIGIVSDFLTMLGRPVDLIQYVDGSILILDYSLGQIYQIVYISN